MTCTNDERSTSLSEVYVTERMAPNWSSKNCLLWPQSRKLKLFQVHETLLEMRLDISLTMQERALLGYGSLRSLVENANFLKDCSDVTNAQPLIDAFRQLEDGNQAYQVCDYQYFP